MGHLFQDQRSRLVFDKRVKKCNSEEKMVKEVVYSQGNLNPVKEKLRKLVCKIGEGLRVQKLTVFQLLCSLGWDHAKKRLV